MPLMPSALTHSLTYACSKDAWQYSGTKAQRKSRAKKAQPHNHTLRRGAVIGLCVQMLLAATSRKCTIHGSQMGTRLYLAENVALLILLGVCYPAQTGVGRLADRTPRRIVVNHKQLVSWQVLQGLFKSSLAVQLTPHLLRMPTSAHVGVSTKLGCCAGCCQLPVSSTVILNHKTADRSVIGDCVADQQLGNC